MKERKKEDTKKDDTRTPLEPGLTYFFSIFNRVFLFFLAYLRTKWSTMREGTLGLRWKKKRCKNNGRQKMLATLAAKFSPTDLLIPTVKLWPNESHCSKTQ